MSKIFKLRRGTTSTMNSSKSNILLSTGEMFLETPSNGINTGNGDCRIKVGDGTSAYNNLSYAVGAPNMTFRDNEIIQTAGTNISSISTTSSTNKSTFITAINQDIGYITSNHTLGEIVGTVKSALTRTSQLLENFEGSGSSVSITPITTSGRKIATFEIDGQAGELYAPSASGESLIYKQTLIAGETTLTFISLPLGNNSRVRLYSDPFVWGLVTSVAQTSSSITLTCTAHSYDVSIMIEIIAPKALPDGKTITPTNDVPLLLECAGIDDKEYTTITQLLSDSVTLEAVIQSNNASDYLKRSTDFASTICADSNAMTLIGANDYCANELLSDDTWLQGICNSTYFESVLNVKVPIMTSNTTPSGEAFASSSYNGRPPYQAFNGRTTNFGTDGLSFWAPSNPGTANTAFIGYEFTQPVQIYKIKFCTLSDASSSPSTQLYQLKGSNDGSNYEVIAEETATDISTAYTGSRYSFNISPNSNNKFKYITLTSVDYARSAGEVQFYGRA